MFVCLLSWSAVLSLRRGETFRSPRVFLTNFLNNLSVYYIGRLLPDPLISSRRTADRSGNVATGLDSLINSFHEKAGECQVFPLFFPLLCCFFFQIIPIEPSRLCRHPSIRTLC